MRNPFLNPMYLIRRTQSYGAGGSHEVDLAEFCKPDRVAGQRVEHGGIALHMSIPVTPAASKTGSLQDALDVLAHLVKFSFWNKLTDEKYRNSRTLREERRNFCILAKLESECVAAVSGVAFTSGVPVVLDMRLELLFRDDLEMVGETQIQQLQLELFEDDTDVMYTDANGPKLSRTAALPLSIDWIALGIPSTLNPVTPIATVAVSTTKTDQIRIGSGTVLAVLDLNTDHIAAESILTSGIDVYAAGKPINIKMKLAEIYSHYKQQLLYGEVNILEEISLGGDGVTGLFLNNKGPHDDRPQGLIQVHPYDGQLVSPDIYCLFIPPTSDIHVAATATQATAQAGGTKTKTRVVAARKSQGRASRARRNNTCAMLVRTKS